MFYDTSLRLIASVHVFNAQRHSSGMGEKKNDSPQCSSEKENRHSGVNCLTLLLFFSSM